MLTVSRSDITGDELIDYAPETRFIKLPIEGYLKLLTFNGKNVWEETNRPQIALINAVNSPNYRFIVAAYSRRLGKTFISNVIGQLVFLIPNCNVLIMSPNYNLSGISFDLQRQLTRQFDLELAKDNVKDKVLELPNGSTIRMGSLSTVDSSVGRSYDLIIFDEAALGEDGESAFNVALRPTLDKPNSKAIFISTPRGKRNWFTKFYDRGFSSAHPQWISLHADYTENPRMTESDVQEARNSMSKAEFEQEYMASFTQYEGQIYKLSEKCIEDWNGGDEWEFFAGCDPGYKDATAFVVIGYNYVQDYYHVVDEYLNAEAVTAGHAEQFTHLLNKWGVEVTFIDSAAAQFAADLAYTYNISTTKAKKDVLPGIAFVQTIIEQDRLKVAPHCENVLAMLDQYQWDNRDTLQKERPLHNEVSHMADALRYALYTFTT